MAWLRCSRGSVGQLLLGALWGPLAILYPVAAGSKSMAVGPSFLVEPPSSFEFYNSTGAVIPCSVSANPSANVTWLRQDYTSVQDIPGLRLVRVDGALVLPPFSAQDYKQEVHEAIYHCVAENEAGRIGSREVRVKGIIRRPIEIRTFDEFAVKGNTAVLWCDIPTGVKDHVKVISWETDDGRTYSGISEGKFSVTTEGLLLIRNVDFIDSRSKYRCITRDRLYGNTLTSSTWGELIVTEVFSSLPSKIRSSSRKVRSSAGHSAELVCVAQGYPQPTYVWFKKANKRMTPLAYSQRFHRQPGGGLMLYKTSIYDTGTYYCVANNTVGEDRAQIELIVLEPISVTMNPTSVLVSEGVSVTFHCNVSGYPISSLSWKQNFQNLATSPRVNLVSKDVLHIASVQRSDKGMYQCFVQGFESSHQAMAQLALKEEAPVFKEAFSERVLRPGSSASLKCVVEGNPLPQIQWSLYGRPVPESSTSRVGDFVDVSGFLLSFVNVTSVNVEHAGLYTCLARNDFGVVSHSAKVYVIGPPYVHTMANVSVVSGQPVTLTCAVAGYPVEHITWRKGENGLARSQRLIDHRNGSVVILQSSKSDEGSYRCEARNGKGERAHGSVHLKVIEKPVINPFLFGGDLREGMRTTVVCSVLTGEPPLVIEWLKDGQSLRESLPDAQVAALGDYTSSLTLSGVTRRHTGNYTCKVTSGLAQTHYTTRMKVNASPKWLQKPTDITVVRGDKVVLNCKAEGEPEPVHRWKYVQGPKTSSTDFRSVVSSPHMHVLENGSLVIVEVDRPDAGLYLCDVNNGVGSPLSSVIDLSVRVPPFFKKPFEVKTVNISSSVLLTCRVFGDSPLTVTWAKDRRPLDRSGNSRYSVQEETESEGVLSELLINHVKKTDSALFSCEAVNDYGKDERSIHLVVEAPPERPSTIRVTQVTSNTAALSWTQAQSSHAPVTGYVVTYLPGTEGDWDAETQSIRCTESHVLLSGLKAGSPFKVRIVSLNNIGTSEPSDEIKFTTEEAEYCGAAHKKRFSSAATSLNSLFCQSLEYSGAEQKKELSTSAAFASLAHRVYNENDMLKDIKCKAPSNTPMQVSAVATSSHSLKISWKFHEDPQESIQVLGFYVGYKEANAPGPFVFKTVEDRNQKVREAELQHLKRSSKYAVSVQAFNKKGAGPATEEILVQTLDFDPPSPPKLILIRESSTSVELDLGTTDRDNPISGYVLHYKTTRGEFQEARISASTSRYNLEDLNCGTQYYLTLSATNNAGRGNPSEMLSVRTTGGAPIAPEKHHLMSVNSTSLLLRLSAWNDGGCPITFYVLQYRLRRQIDWILHSNNIVPGETSVTVSDLNPASWYDLLMAAHNEAGVTEAAYPFSTLTLAGGTIPPPTNGESASSSSSNESTVLSDPAILVPIICGVVVLLVVSIVVAVIVVLRKKDTASECQSQGAYSGGSGGKAENMSMVSYGKIKRADCGGLDPHRESFYYPSPYATTQIAEDAPSEGHTTLRRTGRMAREHDYDIPQRPSMQYTGNNEHGCDCLTCSEIYSRLNRTTNTTSTEREDYTSYAKLWTHTRNSSCDGYGGGTKVGLSLSHLRGTRSPHSLIKSCSQMEGEHLSSPSKEFMEQPGEVSEAECDRDHHAVSLREYQLRRLGDHGLSRLQVC